MYIYICTNICIYVFMIFNVRCATQAAPSTRFRQLSEIGNLGHLKKLQLFCSVQGTVTACHYEAWLCHSCKGTHGKNRKGSSESGHKAGISHKQTTEGSVSSAIMALPLPQCWWLRWPQASSSAASYCVNSYHMDTMSFTSTSFLWQPRSTLQSWLKPRSSPKNNTTSPEV